jgi:hypothetical protein
MEMRTANEFITGFNIDTADGSECTDICNADAATAATALPRRVAAALAAANKKENATEQNHESHQNHLLLVPLQDDDVTTGEGSFTDQVYRDFGGEHCTRPGYPDPVTTDLRAMYLLMSRIAARQGWQHAPQRSRAPVGTEHGHLLTNTLLTLYSQLAVQFCLEKKVHVPVAFVNRDLYVILINCILTVSLTNIHKYITN